MMSFAVIDFVFAGVIVLFILRCAVRGFVSEIMSLAALAFGLLSAIFFFRTVGQFVRERFMPDVSVFPEVIAFVALFLLVFVLARIVESILNGIIRGFNLDGLDRFLGVILGFAEGVVVVCLILFLMNIQPFFDPDILLGNSFFADLLMPFIIGRDWGLPVIIALTENFTGGIYPCLRTL
ncbi:MAG: CvpA family protein [Treponema sp.]|nr:CvpA family protein [Treponema sp.]